MQLFGNDTLVILVLAHIASLELQQLVTKVAGKKNKIHFNITHRRLNVFFYFLQPL